MQVVPVVDLKGGLVVRGVAGRRDEYRPVASLLAADARPHTVAAAFARLGFRTLYVADLDAIGGGEPAWTTYDALAATGLDLWIDAGIGTLEATQRMASFRPAGRQLDGAIAGLESLMGPELLAPLVRAVGAERFIFSLDLNDGRLWSDSPAWHALDPMAAVDAAVQAGVRRLIVLDVAQVGVGQGPGTLALCRRVHQRHAGVAIVAGGGVRSLDDLAALEAAGCAAVLVASSLHDGRIAADELGRHGWL
jgi:phosphoribosylformimino-5-aminoimidazole carboxamide ribotide isomerase